MALRASGPASIWQMLNFVSGGGCGASASRRAVRVPSAHVTGKSTGIRETQAALRPFRSLSVPARFGAVTFGKSLRLVTQERRTVSVAVAVPAEHEPSAEPAEQTTSLYGFALRLLWTRLSAWSSTCVGSAGSGASNLL
jgi:hypothetical protein